MAAQFKEDGNYRFNEVCKDLRKDFSSEKEMCDFLESKMGLFCTEILGVSLQSYQREYKFDISKRNNGSQRIDFFISTKTGENIVVECKNPFYSYENTSAIGQILGYRSALKMRQVRADRFILLTTKIDLSTVLVLSDNDLGIELIAFDKSKVLTLLS